jgi:ABC-type multidrug transport system ATPase subunit
MLEIRQATKRFPKSSFIMQNITCNIGKGLHVLAGPNGSGKSTLLRMAAGILPPDDGGILYRGQDIYANSSRYKQSLGYLPQTFAYYSHMTGMDFLLYLANLKGLFGTFAKKRASFVAELMGISQYCPKKINTWSVGLKQRLSIAQALLSDPDVLILDEPLCSLAFSEVTEVKKLLYQMAKTKVILMSSHILCDIHLTKFLLLANGRLHFVGLPSIFTEEVQGQVWTVVTSKDQLTQLQQAFPKSTAVFAEAGCSLRIISRQKPTLPNIQPTLPTLEEAYLVWLEQLNRKEARESREYSM